LLTKIFRFLISLLNPNLRYRSALPHTQIDRVSKHHIDGRPAS
jgi:hypothetical protein